jgi:hypothetical protein
MGETLEKPVARSTTPARKSVAKSTSCRRKIRRQVHYCHPSAFASDSEGSREAGRGRSRRPGGSRQPCNRLCEGTALARLRPRAPRTRLPPDGSYLADLGRACAGGSRPPESPEITACVTGDSSVTSQPLVRSRTPPGHAGHGRGAGAPPADRPEPLLDTSPPANTSSRSSSRNLRLTDC